jgi:hypothetical protein
MTDAELIKSIRREEDGYARWLRKHSEGEHHIMPAGAALACSCGESLTS